MQHQTKFSMCILQLLTYTIGLNKENDFSTLEFLGQSF